MGRNNQQRDAETQEQMQKRLKRPLTWQEKMDNGFKLSPMDEVKADADFNHNERVRQEEVRKEFEARKNSGYSRKAVPNAADFADEDTLNDTGNDNGGEE